jgi:SAM-dependent methyltransferase
MAKLPLPAGLRRVTKRVQGWVRTARRASLVCLRDVPYHLRGAPDGLPIPPVRLRWATGPEELNAYFRADPDGQTQHLVRFIADKAAAAPGPYTVLDFGCGIGRVVRQLHPLHERAEIRIYGTDINESMIRWCDAHLKFATFAVNGPRPPLDLAPLSLDFVFALTVFTHLSLDQQRSWIDEFSRILLPGGQLYFTTRGSSFAGWLNPGERADFDAEHPVIRHGESAGNPSTYHHCVTFHPPAFVTNDLCREWQQLEFRPGRENEMDIHIFQKSRP